jgi:DNA modification methylase
VTEPRLILGDCIEAMRDLPDGSVDAIVTDPPYGLEFMGKDWDAPWKHGFSETGYTDGSARPPRPNFGSTRNPMCRACRKHQRGTDRCACEVPDFDERPADSNRLFQAWTEAWAKEALRLLKPGGHAVVFGGTRTYHRMASGLEDAGFEIRDCLAWMYGSGFPKSHDVSRAIDKAHGVEGAWVLTDHFGGRAGPRKPSTTGGARLRREPRGATPPL